MNKQAVERIVNNVLNKAIVGFVLLVAVLITMDIYYQQEYPSFLVIIFSVLFSLVLFLGTIKSVLIDLFAALEEESKGKNISK